MRRAPVNKSRSAKQFKSNIKRTKAPNAAPLPTRGGYRM